MINTKHKKTNNTASFANHLGIFGDLEVCCWILTWFCWAKAYGNFKSCSAMVIHGGGYPAGGLPLGKLKA